jgi:hypothetical protein
MVFAVDVGAQTTTQGDELGSGGDGKKPPLGQGKTDDFLKGDARFSAKDARRSIEVQEPVKGQGGDEAARETGVAVAETAALRQQRLPLAREANEILKAAGAAPGGGYDRKSPPTCGLTGAFRETYPTGIHAPEVRMTASF